MSSEEETGSATSDTGVDSQYWKSADRVVFSNRTPKSQARALPGMGSYHNHFMRKGCAGSNCRGWAPRYRGCFENLLVLALP